MRETVFTESFRRGAAKLGGADELGTYLQVSVRTVEQWLNGTTRPPAGAFLRVVDLITGRNGSDPYGR